VVKKPERGNDMNEYDQVEDIVYALERMTPWTAVDCAELVRRAQERLDLEDRATPDDIALWIRDADNGKIPEECLARMTPEDAADCADLVRRANRTGHAWVISHWIMCATVEEVIDRLPAFIDKLKTIHGMMKGRLSVERVN
jgi:hypothetical protein